MCRAEGEASMLSSITRNIVGPLSSARRGGLIALAAVCASCASSTTPMAPTPNGGSQPRVVAFASGPFQLEGYLWEPAGPGPFQTVLYNHGSEKDPGSKAVLGAFFTARGYVFFVPHRRGQGLSRHERLRHQPESRAVCRDGETGQALSD